MFSPRGDLHIVKVTVVHDILQRCRTKAATTLSMAKKARKEHYGGRKSLLTRRKEFLAHYKPYYFKGSETKNWAGIFCRKHSAGFFVSARPPYGKACSGRRHVNFVFGKYSVDCTDGQ